MILGIDASNIRAGGGLTHLIELLKSSGPAEYGFSKTVVWAGKDTLRKVPDLDWLEKKTHPFLNGFWLSRLFWQKFVLTKHAKKDKIKVLYVPGGNYIGRFKPFVTMCRNMLPFETKERKRFPFIKQVRYLLLKKSQSNTFKKSDGLIFLSRFAQREVLGLIGETTGVATIIHHGVSDRFKNQPRLSKPVSDFCQNNPFRILYVSILNWYKHQDKVTGAVLSLKDKGYPVVIDLVGLSSGEMHKKVTNIKNNHPDGAAIITHGLVSYNTLDKFYHSADLFVFASTCENMPNILIEAMKAGLPIACSKKEPMPEFLKDGGLYFDAEKQEEIESAIKTYLDNPSLRAEKALRAYSLSQPFSWNKCASETFSFLSLIANK